MAVTLSWTASHNVRILSGLKIFKQNERSLTRENARAETWRAGWRLIGNYGNLEVLKLGVASLSLPI